MTITEKKINQIANLDVTPKIFTLTAVISNKDELTYMKEELKKVNEIRNNNIKLALKLKELRDKYTEEKAQHKQTTRLMHEYFKAESSLNIVGILCPYLNKEIKLVDCNVSCFHGYCNLIYRGYECTTRVNHIIQHFKIPFEE